MRVKKIHAIDKYVKVEANIFMKTVPRRKRLNLVLLYSDWLVA